MTDDKSPHYYSLMLNALAGLLDDLDANEAPTEAKELLLGA